MEQIMIFEVTVTRKVLVREGYGVWFAPVWSGKDNPPERIVDVDAGVVRIAQDTITYVGGLPCVAIPESSVYIPVECFEDVPDLPWDDTHDLRDRWFPTEQAARAHLESVLSRWAHPAPWESFICLG